MESILLASSQCIGKAASARAAVATASIFVVASTAARLIFHWTPSSTSQINFLKEGVGTEGFPGDAKELPVVLGAIIEVGNSYTEGIPYIVLILILTN
jgi:hypothetical protein